MKKMFLVPMLVIPFLSLFSCAKTSDYELNEADRENAIGIIGVNFLQASMETTATESHNTLTEQFSPTVYYSKHINTEEPFYNEESYVAKIESDHYIRWSRKEEGEEFQKIDPTTPSDWEDIAHHAEGILTIYNGVKDKTSFVYNKDEKCYIASVVYDVQRIEIKFYFYKKKLVKWVQGTYVSDLNVMFETTNYEYEEIAPTPPTQSIN